MPVADGDVIEVSPVMRVRVLATPGHTFTHLSYVLAAAGHAHAVFTGGSLLYGSTGRPDLLGRVHAGELAHAQFASAHRLASVLPEDADVYPTHGFGSFCSATQAEGNSSTIGRERRVNPVLILAEDRYVSELLAGLDAYPAYYAHMGPANAAGPGGPDLSAAQLTNVACYGYKSAPFPARYLGRRQPAARGSGPRPAGSRHRRATWRPGRRALSAAGNAARRVGAPGVI